MASMDDESKFIDSLDSLWFFSNALSSKPTHGHIPVNADGDSGSKFIEDIDSLWFFSTNAQSSSNPTHGHIPVKPDGDAGEVKPALKHTAIPPPTIQNPETVIPSPQTSSITPLAETQQLTTTTTTPVHESKPVETQTTRSGAAERGKQKEEQQQGRRKWKRLNKLERGGNHRDYCSERVRREIGFEVNADDEAVMVVRHLRTIVVSRNDRDMKRRLKIWAAAVASSVSHHTHTAVPSPMVSACC